ncbi:MAG: cobyric acid synthase [Firmicutes bacterium]|nr:cobyric acid synthase [Bacillota bacterium]
MVGKAAGRGAGERAGEEAGAMTTRYIMVQGTGSHVGKSVLCAALCRILKQDGWRVSPFKAQNMALNSAVTPEGGEIGRAQALQAAAAGVEPSIHMNPVLLKPTGEATSQVIVHGRARGVLGAVDYRERFLPEAWAAVLESLAVLRESFQIIVIEGAGSPAEVNLRSRDIVNMRLARELQAPVILVGDIERGGIFASLIGTVDLLPPEERALLAGLVINKFRGDPALLEPGLAFIEERTGLPVLGVLPYLRELGLEEEDSVALGDRAAAGGMAAGRTPGGRTASARTASGQRRPSSPGAGAVSETGNAILDPAEVGDISPYPGKTVAANSACSSLSAAVLALPRISNFTDFDALEREGLSIRYVGRPEELGDPDVVIIPGTKNTSADLLFLREKGLDQAILRRAAEGVPVLGICGGYQILGRALLDPDGVESDRRELPGLGLLDLVTVFAPEKITVRAQGRVDEAVAGAAVTVAGSGLLAGMAGVPVHGYEIHAGLTTLGPTCLPALRLRSERPGRSGAGRSGGETAGVAVAGAGSDHPDGAMALGGMVMGTYLHGLFDSDEFRWGWLANLSRLSRQRRAARMAWAAREANSPHPERGPRETGEPGQLTESREPQEPRVSRSDRAREEALDRLAIEVRNHLDLETILTRAGLKRPVGTVGAPSP